MSARRREDAAPRGLLGARSVLSPPRTSPWAWIGLAGVALVTAPDVALGSRAVLASALSVVVLVVAVLGRRGDAAVVGAASVVVAAVSGLWNGWGLGWLVSVVVVVAASAVAVVVTLGRDRSEATARQLALLRELLELGRDRAGVTTIAERAL